MAIPVKIIRIALFLCAFGSLNAQIQKQEKTMIIDSIAKLVKKYYVLLDEGEKMANVILQKNASGGYDSITNPQKLANQLTADLRSINGDLHMYVQHKILSKKTKIKEPSLKVDKKGAWSNYGFQEINVLDGNIGYLKISHFTTWKNFEAVKKVVTSSINSLKNTDAIIIDVRNNHGGFENIVAYLISYFYDGASIHLSDYYYRYADERYGVYTTVDIPGTKLPKTPLYVLVNGRTASAGESLAYMLKHLGRATIIGETTAGAGNGAMNHRVNDRFEVTIASETTINAVTKTSFEKVGVIPTIKTDSEDAYNTGYRLALEHLKKTNDSIHPSNYDTLLKFISTKKEVTTIDSKEYQKYIGRYKGTIAEIIVSVKGEHLYAQLVGKGGKIKLIPKGDHTFLVDGEKEHIQFVLDQKGKAIKLIGIDSPMDLKKVE
tara:strand:- start:76059 stop:77360 length:1302 start_codon:yes stop_codon:yes gene_type:complete